MNLCTSELVQLVTFLIFLIHSYVLADMKGLEEDVVSIKSELNESIYIYQFKTKQEQAMLSEQDIDQDIEKSLVESLSQEYDIKLEDGNKGDKEQEPISKKGTKKCKKISKTKFQCPLCLQYFKGGVILKRHVLRNTCYKPFHCPHCPKSFRTGDRLENI